MNALESATHGGPKQMQAYILETLLLKGWRKGGEVFWTVEDATGAGRTLLKRKLARAVRVLPLEVTLDPVAELPERGQGHE